MKEIGDMSVGELAAYVCNYLNDNGIECVLTGGACASIYSDNKYLSYDIDFIDRSYSTKNEIKNALSKIGFNEKDRYFVHADTNFFIEFPPGPLTVGNENVKTINEIIFETGKLLLLTPTDSVKDRLASYFHWDDLQSLNQAVLIANVVTVDLKNIKDWAINEKNLYKFNIFKKRIRKK